MSQKKEKKKNGTKQIQIRTRVCKGTHILDKNQYCYLNIYIFVLVRVYIRTCKVHFMSLLSHMYSHLYLPLFICIL